MANNNDPVVANFLGMDVKFSASDREFYAIVEGGVGGLRGSKVRVEAKSLDELEKKIVEAFRPRNKVRVMTGYLSPYSARMSDVKAVTVREIIGFFLDRGRGRGATKTIGYEMADGGRVALGGSGAFRRFDSRIVDELDTLREEFAKIKAEFDRVEQEFVGRAKELLAKAEKITPEEILEQLNSDPPKPVELRVVERTEVPDIFKKGMSEE